MNLDAPEMKALSAKRRKFVVAYIGCANASAAAEAAGYSPKSAHVTGCRLLKDAKVQAALKALTEPEEKSRVMTALEMHEFLSDVARGEPMDIVTDLAGKPLVDKSTGLTLALPAKPNVRVSATEKLAKMRGMWKERHEVTHRTEFDGLSLDEVIDRLEKKLAQLKALRDRKGAA